MNPRRDSPHGPEHLRLDHVLVAVADLEAAAQWWRAEFGLGSVEGGRFSDGVESRVIPVGGEQYIELLTVFELTDASLPLRRVIDAGGGCVDWAVSTARIEAVASRLGREIERGSLTLADGTTSSWSYVFAEPGSQLPFYVQYDSPERRPLLWEQRNAAANHERQPAGFAWLRTPSPSEKLAHWLGGADLPVHAGDGSAVTFAVEMTDGRTVLFGTDSD
jgi:catechol 2,3-dioxygenase-like lactoylglutathione lyase family enzyme